MKMTVIIGFVMFICLIFLWRKVIPRFKVTFLRLVLLLSGCMMTAFFVLKILAVIGVVLAVTATFYLFFKLMRRIC